MNEKKEKKQKVERSFRVDSQLNDVIAKVIQNENVYVGQDGHKAKICGLMVAPNISNSIAGKCVKSGRELKHFSGYDYLLQISEQLWGVLSDEIKYLLVYHELLHIDVKWSKNATKPTYALRDHNVKDFRQIIEKYGIDWIRQIELVSSSLSDRDGQIRL